MIARTIPEARQAPVEVAEHALAPRGKRVTFAGSPTDQVLVAKLIATG
jgi:hypothetical protein